MICLQIWEFAAHLYPSSRQEMQSITQSADLPEVAPILLFQIHFTHFYGCAGAALLPAPRAPDPRGRGSQGAGVPGAAAAVHDPAHLQPHWHPALRHQATLQHDHAHGDSQGRWRTFSSGILK